MSFLLRTNVALIVLTGVACTKVIGLPDLPVLGEGGAPGASGQTGGTVASGGSSANGGAVSSGGKSANGGAVSSGGSSATGGSTGDGGGESGGTAGAGGSDLGGTSGAGGSMGGDGGASGGSSATGGSVSSGGSSATGGSVSSGGSSATGGSAGNGGGGSGGTAGAGGSDVGGASGAGGSTGGGTSGASGSGGSSGAIDGPCDVYAAATPCVGAYSTIRRLSRTYTGPLYQVRSGSSTQNTGTGGVIHDIGMTAEGFADADAHDVACGGSVCTISRLYDQSGNNNDLSVAKRGSPLGGAYSDQDDFESNANAKELTVGGHRVYALYTEARQGYRLPVQGNGVPLGTAAQGIYMLADGTRVGSACCWDFGNVTVDPTQFHAVNALILGVAYWGKGAGAGPWFLADFGSGVWAGGSSPGDPGWGLVNDQATTNPNNPTLRVPFALGFLKTSATQYALRMADAQTAATLSTAYQGNLPQQLDNQGAIVLGVGADNSNNAYATFYEGAVLSGFPTDAAELGVLQNIKAAGYGL